MMSDNREYSRLFDDYTSIIVQGFGTYGKIYVGTNNLTEHKHVIKISKYDSNSSNPYGDESENLKEIKIMDKLKHENILNFKCSWIEKHSTEWMKNRDLYDFKSSSRHEFSGNNPDKKIEFLFVAMEYCYYGNLEELLKIHGLETYGPTKSVPTQIVEQIACGLQYLNSKNLIHCDLQPKNIFVNDNRVVKIGKFRSAVKFHLTGNTIKCPESTRKSLYASPEQINGSLIDEKVDIYALGIIFLKILHPSLEEADFEDVRSGKIPESISQDYSSETELINMMLKKNPSERISMKDLTKKLVQLKFHISTFGNILSGKGPHIWSNSEPDYDFFCFKDDSSPISDFIRKDEKTLKNINSVIRKFTKAAVETDITPLIDIFRERKFEEEILNMTSEFQIRYPMMRSKTNINTSE